MCHVMQCQLYLEQPVGVEPRVVLEDRGGRPLDEALEVDLGRRVEQLDVRVGVARAAPRVQRLEQADLGSWRVMVCHGVSRTRAWRKQSSADVPMDSPMTERNSRRSVAPPVTFEW